MNIASLAAVSPPLGQLGEEFFRERTETGCVQENGVFCVDWALDNFDRYLGPTMEQLILVAVSVAAGFAIAFGLALISHRRRWLVPSITGVTGVLYTVPSLAFFFLLIPITGRGADTAVIALTAYTLQIIYRNIVAGLANVPPEARDSGRGMGMTDRQLLWKVELPLAAPEIIAGLRVATVSTVALATLAVFAGGGGLGEEIYADLTFKTNVVIAGGLAILMAIAFDILWLGAQRMLVPWRRVRPV
jgi:osmoprotectant transport system permease protein